MRAKAATRSTPVTCCRALSDDTRFRILEQLVGKETCVCELVDQLEVAQPLLSHHLKTLKDAGIVRARKRGRWMFYSLQVDALEDMANTLLKLAERQRRAAKSLELCCR